MLIKKQFTRNLLNPPILYMEQRLARDPNTGLVGIQIEENGEWKWSAEPKYDQIFYYDKDSPYEQKIHLELEPNSPEGLAFAKINGKYGFVTLFGEEVIPIIFDHVTAPYIELDSGATAYANIFICEKGDTTSIYTASGELKWQRNNTNVSQYSHEFAEGMLKFEVNGKFGFLNDELIEVIPPEFDFASVFKDGMSVVSKNGKVGYIDKKGNQIIDCKYEIARPFTEGLAAVAIKGKRGKIKYGYIDKYERLVIDFIYDNAFQFKEGKAKVYNSTFLGNHKGYIIDKNNNVLGPWDVPIL